MDFATAFISMQRGHKVKRKHWKGYWIVEDGEMDRCYLYKCQADTPEAKTDRWLDHEAAVIQLQSMYIPNEDTA